ncbi:MAG: hypothetical protein ACXVFV_08670, partial [Mycobacteriales bacterium]
MRRSVSAALLAAALLALTACSSSGAPARRAATPATTAPVPSAPASSPSTRAADQASPGRLSAWRPCADGFECATLTVALDDAEPALGTVGLALTRHRATGGPRLGSLLVNPGGPGASAVEYLQASYQGYPQTVRQHFDLVAFDPRGVGLTAPVRCLSTAQLDAYFHLDPVPDTEAELAA